MLRRILRSRKRFETIRGIIKENSVTESQVEAARLVYKTSAALYSSAEKQLVIHA